jgi:hypothetical protein
MQISVADRRRQEIKISVYILNEISYNIYEQGVRQLSICYPHARGRTDGSEQAPFLNPNTPKTSHGQEMVK